LNASRTRLCISSLVIKIHINNGLHVPTVLEGFGYVLVTEAAQAERPGDLTVLLRNRLPRREKRAESVKTDEEVLLGHGEMVACWEKRSSFLRQGRRVKVTQLTGR
jgi:hypothetical protein